MKKYVILVILSLSVLPLFAQVNETITATTTSATRLFADKEDLTSVLFLVPSGTVVQIMESDSTHYKVLSEGYEGYIVKRHAEINTEPVVTEEQIALPQTQEQLTDSGSRLSLLQSKYDPNTAKSIYERKIWKGMDTDMVIDSWGNPKKIDRTIIPDSVKEEWSYTSTWLYFEDDILISWGPIEN